MGSLAGEDKERGLKGILGIMRVSERIAADARDHRPMPLDEHLEGKLGGLIPLRHKPFKQLLIGHAGGRALQKECPDQRRYRSGS